MDRTINGGSSENPPADVTVDMFNELQLELMTLKAEVARLRNLLDDDPQEDPED